MSLLVDGIKMQTRPVCVSGWTLSDDELSCQKVSTMAPETTGDGNLLVKHYYRINRGNWGTVFYKFGGVNSDGSWPIDTTTYYPTIYTPLSSSTYSHANAIYYDSGLWINQNNTTIDGRLNRCGVWLSTDEYYVGILGFSRQINIPESGYYYFGVGTDDYSTISVDGIDIVTQDTDKLTGSDYFNDNPTNVWYYRYWHMYPIYLTGGLHTFSVKTTNYTNVGVLGFELYNGTEEQLLACTSEQELDAYTIFSTKNISDGEKFDIGNYYCTNPDYQLIYDSSTQTYYCRKIDTTKPNYIS